MAERSRKSAPGDAEERRADKSVQAFRDALEKMNIPGMTVTEVRGHGRQKGHTAIYRGKEYNVSLLPKMQVEVVVTDSSVEDAIRAIVEAARTGEIGDGRMLEPEEAEEIVQSHLIGGQPVARLVMPDREAP